MVLVPLVHNAKKYKMCESYLEKEWITTAALSLSFRLSHASQEKLLIKQGSASTRKNQFIHQIKLLVVIEQQIMAGTQDQGNFSYLSSSCGLSLC